MVVDVLIRRKDKAGQGMLDQGASRHTQHVSGSEIGLQDQPLLADGEIAHRRQIVQIEIPRPGSFQFFLCPAHFLVLYRKLDLMHPQLVDQLPRLFGGKDLYIFR